MLKYTLYIITLLLTAIPSFAQFPEEGVDYVDLGLTSGTLWATRNVGATQVASYGKYYAWGETQEKETYYWSTYFDSVNGSSINFNTYKAGGETSVIYTDHDVARVVMGRAYQMPTLDQWQELKDECTWTSSQLTHDGETVNGYTVTGTNGNTIFLPSAGSKYGSECSYQGRYFYYWAGELYYVYDQDQSSSLACYMDASFNNPFAFYGASRCNGYPVRAVINNEALQDIKEKLVKYDLNGDGKVDVGDITILTNFALGK